MKKSSFAKFPKTIGMIPLVAIGLFLFVTWSWYSEIDQTVKSNGQIISNSRTQVIQVSDGGVLSELFVEEGELVEAGQLLAYLEPERAEAGYEESKARVMSLKAAVIRLRAELSNSRPIYGGEFDNYQDFVAVQLGYFTQRKKALSQQLMVIRDAISMAKKEQEMNITLLANGDVGELEVFRAKRQLLELQAKENATINQYLQEARADEIKTQDELVSQSSKLTERLSILRHTKITAPISGVVKLLKVTTIGGVLRSGDELMQISPNEDEVVVEIKVNPSDVGQLSLNMPVTIKMDAFDYSIYGTLLGKLVYISSDTLTEQSSNGQSFTYYRARVVLDKDQSHNPRTKDIHLKLGMVASVDIRTDTRSIFKYLSKPIAKSFSGAFSER
jgi:adhesin transport system membrane fusion protein